MNISQLAGRHGLSRSTLLYYDRIGLLTPSGRSAAGYREYSEADEGRLVLICTYRRAGLSLKDIARVLDAPSGRIADALHARLDELDKELESLREQQRMIAKLLGSGDLPVGDAVMDKETWVSLLVASGYDEDAMEAWHADFERTSPEKHERFLRFLGIDEDEVQAIRARAVSARTQG
jgi:DNA-binding transcriptional MerR regulator